MKIIGKEKTTTSQKPHWQYKIYITTDGTVPNSLVESLAPIDGEEFLNKDVSNENEEDLFQMLTIDNFYIVGKRLVKYLYAIPNIKVIVCELARLSPEKFLSRYGMNMQHKTNLDDNPDKTKTGEKRHIPGEIVKNIRKVQEGEKINV